MGMIYSPKFFNRSEFQSVNHYLHCPYTRTTKLDCTGGLGAEVAYSNCACHDALSFSGEIDHTHVAPAVGRVHQPHFGNL